MTASKTNRKYRGGTDILRDLWISVTALTVLQRETTLLSAAQINVRALSLGFALSVAALAICVAFAGCSNRAPLDPEVVSREFAFLREGKTSREEIKQRLGKPMSSYESERILVYRAREKPRTHFEVGDKGYYHLVLVFEPNGTLEKYSLVSTR